MPWTDLAQWQQWHIGDIQTAMKTQYPRYSILSWSSPFQNWGINQRWFLYHFIGNYARTHFCAWQTENRARCDKKNLWIVIADMNFDSPPLVCRIIFPAFAINTGCEPLHMLIWVSLTSVSVYVDASGKPCVRTPILQQTEPVCISLLENCRRPLWRYFALRQNIFIFSASEKIS